jgi:hypothetical protein
MITQYKTNTKRRRLSELSAVAAIVILAIYIEDTFIAQSEYGFLQLTDIARGLLIGIPSMILLFISFGIGNRQKSGLATSPIMGVH